MLIRDCGLLFFGHPVYVSIRHSYDYRRKEPGFCVGLGGLSVLYVGYIPAAAAFGRR